MHAPAALMGSSRSTRRPGVAFEKLDRTSILARPAVPPARCRGAVCLRLEHKARRSPCAAVSHHAGEMVLLSIARSSNSPSNSRAPNPVHPYLPLRLDTPADNG